MLFTPQGTIFSQFLSLACICICVFLVVYLSIVPIHLSIPDRRVLMMASYAIRALCTYVTLVNGTSEWKDIHLQLHVNYHFHLNLFSKPTQHLSQREKGSWPSVSTNSFYIHTLYMFTNQYYMQTQKLTFFLPVCKT